MSVEATVRKFLSEELGKSTTDVGAEESLLESGILDSMGVLKLVAFLESKYRIKVNDDDLMPDNFDTIAAMISFIERRQAETNA